MIPLTIQAKCECGQRVTFNATDRSGNGYRCSCPCHKERKK